jgi:hypothetical protein
MKTKKSISSIFKQGGNAKMNKVLSSQAFMPADAFYANMFQLGGLAALPFGNRLPKAQNGVLASAVNPDPNAMPANWQGVPFDPGFAPSAATGPAIPPTVADAYRNMLAAAGADDTGIGSSLGFSPSAVRVAAASPVSGPPQLNLPPTGPVGGVPYWNMPTDPNQVVPATPDLVGVNPMAAAAAAPTAPAANAAPSFTPGVTPEGFIQVAQKEGETRWQYRYDPKNDIWQAYDTRRPEKGWMIPDAGKKQGQKADKAIRDRYQKDANSVVSEVFVKPAIPAYQSAVASQVVDDSMPTAQQIAALPTVTQTAPQSITSRYDLSPSIAQPVESSITNAVETAPGSGTFVDSTGMTFSRMPAEEAARIRSITPRVERPLNLKPQMNEGPNKSTPPPARELPPVARAVGKYNVNSNVNGDITISDGKNTYNVPEELGLNAEDLSVLSDSELKSLLKDFEDIISDREQKDFFNVTNTGRNERPGTVATNRRQPARRYTANRMNGGYGTSYFRDIADTFMDGGYPETMQSGGIPSMMGSALSNPAMSNRLLNTMSGDNMNSQTMFNPNTTTVSPRNMMDGGMPMMEVQTMSTSVKKMDPIRDFIKSPYTISSPEYDNYSKGDSYPGVSITNTFSDQMYGLPKVLKRIKR